ncbi:MULTISPECIES: hypothetical protein [Hydrogenophilus]|nr:MULTISPECIES: hypothetical protein [Hydrogenophilus]
MHMRQYLVRVRDGVAKIDRSDEIVARHGVIFVFHRIPVWMAWLFQIGFRFDILFLTLRFDKVLVRLEALPDGRFAVQTPTGVSVAGYGVLVPGYFQGRSNVRQGELLVRESRPIFGWIPRTLRNDEHRI